MFNINNNVYLINEDKILIHLHSLGYASGFIEVMYDPEKGRYYVVNESLVDEMIRFIIYTLAHETLHAAINHVSEHEKLAELED